METSTKSNYIFYFHFCLQRVLCESNMLDQDTTKAQQRLLNISFTGGGVRRCLTRAQ